MTDPFLGVATLARRIGPVSTTPPMATDLTTAWDTCLASPAASRLARDVIASPPEDWTDARDDLAGLVQSKPEEAFLVILAAVRLIEDEKTMYWFAAGPLEDFLGTHGPAFIDRIHAIALRERRLRVFLGAVWESSMQKDVWRRVDALADRPTQYGKWDSGLTAH